MYIFCRRRQKEAEKLGAISRDVKVSYKVPYSGEYYILDGENKENITDRVIVEHEGGAEDNMKNFSIRKSAPCNIPRWGI